MIPAHAITLHIAHMDVYWFILSYYCVSARFTRIHFINDDHELYDDIYMYYEFIWINSL